MVGLQPKPAGFLDRPQNNNKKAGSTMIQFLATVPQGWQIHSRIEPMSFPAGERHLRNTDQQTERALAALVTGTDANDYVTLAAWADLVHSQGQKAVALIPYLPGARADRGHPFGAKIYADLINMANLDQVICFDPHSPVMPGLIDNLTIVHADIPIRNHVQGRSGKNGYVGVLCPDEGAVERSERIARALHLPVFYATKHRDFDTGKLSGFVPPADLPAEGRLLLADDICDGGGTFIGLAEAASLTRDRLTLWVSHGVFSGNAHLLTEHFGEIYTTDSFPNATRPDVYATVVPLLPYLLRAITIYN